MENFELLAKPFPVNLATLIPFILWFVLGKGIKLGKNQLISSAVFAFAFGITEAVVVVYLRTISQLDIQQAQVLAALPVKIASFEQIRELCTVIMLSAVSFLAVNTLKEKLTLFLYTFSIWDIAYYLGLRVLVGWPQTLTTPDVLFLIPVPWISQVWFPILISLAIILIILAKVR